MSSSTSQTQVLKAASAMGTATFLSRIMGLVREQAFAFLFGASNVTDAFNVAFRIPNLLRDLFAEGAMSASLVPTFTQSRLKEGDRRAWRVAGLVFRVLFVFVGALSVIGIIFAPELVSLYASAFKAIPGKFELTVTLTRVMFPFFPLVALAAAFMGILNSCGIFFLPAFASALFNITSVCVGVTCAQVFLYFGRDWGIQPIQGMAIGVVVGGAVQAFCQLPTLKKAGYRWEPKIASDPHWNQDPWLRQMLWMMVPGTIGLAATQVNLLVNTVLATREGPGAVSWLSYAFRLMQFPIGVFGVSLASATLPRVSLQWAQKDVKSVEETLIKSIRSVFAINFPAAAGLAFLGYPIIELIFQYGRFYSEDTRATALALAMYAIGLPAYSMVKVLVPACYALGNTRLPVLSSVLAVGITLILNLFMVRAFGFWGLALGTSIAAIFNGAFLIGALRKILQKNEGNLPIKPLLRGAGEYGALALSMGLICYFSHRYLNFVLPDQIFYFYFGKSGTILGRCVKLGIFILEGILWVFWISRFFHFSEMSEVFDLFAKKLKNKLRRKPT